MYRNHQDEIDAALAGLPTVAESLSQTNVHLAKIDQQLAHTNPCRLAFMECEICQDREWSAAHAEGAGE